MNQPEKRKHNYTSELELKSLLIRVKNDRYDVGTTEFNNRVNKYIKYYTDINNKKYESPAKRNLVKSRIKDRIIRDSESIRIDQASYERFGEIILLMIKNILRKPQFSGYTYKDDFYSDAVYKIIKYLHNFDHTKISEISGQNVNAFAYISQYIHNSIIYIINKKKKESDRLKNRIRMENLNHNLQLKNYELIDSDSYHDDMVAEMDDIDVELVAIDSLVKELEYVKGLFENDLHDGVHLNIVYPADYVITFEEYEMLKPLLSGNISITRKREVQE